MSDSGTLFIVSTPIGNLEDITIRALRVLKEVQFIIAEDTKHSLKLLNYYDIRKPVFSFHQRISLKRLNYYFSRIEKGENAAVITDAGTPGISDPGEKVINEAINRRINLDVIPGTSAVVAAITLSGAPVGRGFIFLGFLPKTKRKKRRILDEIRLSNRTVVFFESPVRIKETIRELKEFVGGNKNIAIMRELTKIYQEVLRGTVEQVIEDLKKRDEFFGEITVVVW